MASAELCRWENRTAGAKISRLGVGVGVGIGPAWTTKQDTHEKQKEKKDSPGTWSSVVNIAEIKGEKFSLIRRELFGVAI